MYSLSFVLNILVQMVGAEGAIREGRRGEFCLNGVKKICGIQRCMPPHLPAALLLFFFCNSLNLDFFLYAIFSFYNGFFNRFK